MGRLAGFSYRDIVRKLRKAGFTFDRQAKSSHEIWWRIQKPENEQPYQTILDHYPKEPFEQSLNKLI